MIGEKMQHIILNIHWTISFIIPRTFGGIFHEGGGYDHSTGISQIFEKCSKWSNSSKNEEKFSPHYKPPFPTLFLMMSELP